MIKRNHPLPVCKQAKALKLSRSSVYYRPRPVSDAALGLMRRIDELHLERPFAGSSQRRRPPEKKMRDMLREEDSLCRVPTCG